MNRTLHLTFFALCLILGACSSPSQPQTALDTVQVKTAIEGLNKRFSELFVKGDSAGVANLYTHDAKFMDAGAPAVTGRAAIQSTMAGFMKAGITKVDFHTTAVFGCDSLVAEEGNLQLFIQSQKVADDKYIVLWKKEEGQWKIFRDISNSNLPPSASK